MKVVSVKVVAAVSKASKAEIQDARDLVSEALSDGGFWCKKIPDSKLASSPNFSIEDRKNRGRNIELEEVIEALTKHLDGFSTGHPSLFSQPVKLFGYLDGLYGHFKTEGRTFEIGVYDNTIGSILVRVAPAMVIGFK